MNEEAAKTVTIGSKCRQLRTALKDQLAEHRNFDDEYFLSHWLRVNKMDVEKTEAAIRASMKWRKENSIDKLIEEDEQQFPPELVNKTPILFGHRTKTGAEGVVYYQGGHAFFADLVKNYGRGTVLRYWLYAAFRMERQVLEYERKRGRDLEVPALRHSEKIIKGYGSDGGTVGIVDVEGYSMKCFLSLSDLQLMFEIITTIYTHCPVAPWTAYFINTNKVFQVCFRLLKPIFRQFGLTIHVYGTDEEKWTGLVQQVDLQDIREYQNRSADMLTRDDTDLNYPSVGMK